MCVSGNKAPQKGKHSAHACITVPPGSAQWDWQIEIFPFVKHFLEICNIHFINLSLLSLFSFLFSRKDAICLKITCWNAGCSFTACSQFHIYCCLWGIKICHVVSGETCPILLFITSCMPGCLKKTPLWTAAHSLIIFLFEKSTYYHCFRFNYTAGFHCMVCKCCI